METLYTNWDVGSALEQLQEQGYSAGIVYNHFRKWFYPTEVSMVADQAIRCCCNAMYCGIHGHSGNSEGKNLSGKEVSFWSGLHVWVDTVIWRVHGSSYVVPGVHECGSAAF